MDSEDLAWAVLGSVPVDQVFSPETKADHLGLAAVCSLLYLPANVLTTFAGFSVQLLISTEKIPDQINRMHAEFTCPWNPMPPILDFIKPHLVTVHSVKVTVSSRAG